MSGATLASSGRPVDALDVTESSFDAAWPALARAAGRALARRGVSSVDRDDVLQETAIRLYRSWDRLDSTGPMAPLACKVAINVWLNMCERASTRHELATECLPERAAPTDVEANFAVRAELGRVIRLVHRLRPSDQCAIRGIVADEIGMTEAGPTDTRTRVARQRARRRLVYASIAAGTRAG